MKSGIHFRANSFVLATVLALAALCAGLYGFAATDSSNQLLRVYLCVAAALLVQMILYHGLCRLHPCGGKGLREQRWMAVAAGAAVAVAGGAAVCSLFPAEGAFAGLPVWLMLAGVAAVVLVVWPAVNQPPAEGTTFRDRLPVLGTYLFSLGSYLAFCYVPNLVNGSGHQIHHVTAITQSLYNAAFSTPYTVRTTGVYGHYAIFFWPFLHLFGHKPETVAVMIAVCGAAVQTMLTALLLRTVRSKMLVALAVLASANLAANSQDAYLQVFPMRHLWPVALLLFTVCCLQKGGFTRKRVILGYVLCSLAVVWNTDSGLVTLVAFTAFVWIWHWQTRSPWELSMLRVYGGTVAGMLGAVLGMVAVINLYNLACGGQVLLRGCFFPLIGSGGYTQQLSENLLSSGGIGWLLPILLFSVSVLLGLTATTWMPVSENQEPLTRLYLLAAGVMGLGQSYYYFNRSIAGTGCIQPYQILCLALLASYGLPLGKTAVEHVWKGARAGLGALSVFILCGLSLSALAGAAPTLSERVQAGTYSMQSLLDVAAEVQQKVPENTYAFGDLTQEIYGQLGWDPGYHQRDVSDLQFDIRIAQEQQDQTSLEVLADVNSQDTLLIHPWQMNAILDNNDLVPVFGIPESEPVLYYCTRDAEIPSAFDTAGLGKNSLPAFQTKATGINRREGHYEFETVSDADLLLAADAIHEKGFVLRVDTDQELFNSNGQEQFTIEVLLDGTSVGTLPVQAAADPQHLELTVPATEMPDIPADGLYRVELVCHTSQEVSDTTVMYYLTYAGAPAE